MDTEFNSEVAKVLARLDDVIVATPTGPLRNLLTDAVLVIQALQSEVDELRHRDLQGGG